MATALPSANPKKRTTTLTPSALLTSVAGRMLMNSHGRAWKESPLATPPSTMAVATSVGLPCRSRSRRLATAKTAHPTGSGVAGPHAESRVATRLPTTLPTA